MNAHNQISLFYSYAQADTELRDELDKHLSSLRRGGFVTQWYDRYISAGTERVDQTNQHLNTADIILLLISSDFLASDYCYSQEMNRALERHHIGEARVIPVLLRHVDWEDTPFAHLQVLPQNGSPITDWLNRDLAFKDIALQLRVVVKELQASPTNTSRYQKELVQSNNPQRDRTNDLLDRNRQQEPLQIPQAFSHFRYCQEKVGELKSIHNMLHEIEVQLEGLSETIQRAMRTGRQAQKEKISQHLPDFDYIEIAWQRTVPKMEDLTYFAAEEMKTLEQERFSFDNDVIRGPLWVKDLFTRQRAFEIEVEDRNIVAIKKISDELLTKCRYHLYHIDRRLLSALKELDAASDLIVRYRT